MVMEGICSLLADGDLLAPEIPAEDDCDADVDDHAEYPVGGQRTCDRWPVGVCPRRIVYPRIEV